MATQCKLYTDTAQLIEPNVWTTIKFDEVLRNNHSMYQGSLDVTDPKSALIQPDKSGDFIWSRLIKWDTITIPSGDVRPRQFTERFVRDPYTSPDNTGQSDGCNTVGQDIRLGTWQFRGNAGQPVAVEVQHNHHVPVAIVHAQFVATTWDY